MPNGDQQGLDDIIGAKDFYSVPVPEQLRRLRTNKNFSALPPRQQGAYLYRAKASQIPEKGYQDEVNPPQTFEGSFDDRAARSFFRTYSPQFFQGSDYAPPDQRSQEELSKAGYRPGVHLSNIGTHTIEEAKKMWDNMYPYYRHPIDSFTQDPAGTVAAWTGLRGAVEHAVRGGWKALPESRIKQDPSLLYKVPAAAVGGAARGAVSRSGGDIPSLGLGYPGYHAGHALFSSFPAPIPELGGAATATIAARTPAMVQGAVRAAREAYTGIPSEIGLKGVTINDLQNAVKYGDMSLDEFDQALKNKNLGLSTAKQNMLSRTMRAQMAQKGATTGQQTPAQLKANQALAKEAQVRTQREAAARARGEASQVSEQEAARARNEALAKQGATRTQREATARTGAEEAQASEQEAAQRRNEALARSAATRTQKEGAARTSAEAAQTSEEEAARKRNEALAKSAGTRTQREASARSSEEAAQSSQEETNRKANEALARAAEAKTRREAAAKAKAKGEEEEAPPAAAPGTPGLVEDPRRKQPPPPTWKIGGGSEGGPFDAPVEPSKDWEEKGMQQKMREGAEKYPAPASGRDPFSGKFEQVGKYGDVPRPEPTEQQITDWQAPYRAAKELTLARHLVSTGVDLSEIKYTKEYAKAISKEAGLKYEASEQTLKGAIQRARQMQDEGGPIHIEYEKPLDVEAPKEKTGLEKRRETQRGSFSLKPKEPLSERAKRAQSLIQSRDRLFHQIDMDNLQSALQHGIKYRTAISAEEWQHIKEGTSVLGDEDIKEILAKEGVSLSRVPAHGAGTPSSYVTGRPSTLEVARGEMPSTRPIAEGGFQKTRYREPTTAENNNLKMLDQEAMKTHEKYLDAIRHGSKDEVVNAKYDYDVAANRVKAYQTKIWAKQRNPYFEFEERTRNAHVPPEAIKAVHLDLEKLRARHGSGFQKYYMDLAKELTDATNKHLVMHDTTREMTHYLAAKSKLPTLFAKGGTIKHPTRGIVGEAGPELVDKGTDMELVLHPKLMGLGKGYKVVPL